MKQVSGLALLGLCMACATGTAEKRINTVTNSLSNRLPIVQKSVEGIEEYALENGLKVLFFPDPSLDTVTVNITYLVGSRHEGRGEAGMAHLLEHMLFKGTPQFPNVKGVLQDRGAFYNATTWFDRTNYFETLPASSDNLRFVLELEADRMIHSWVRKEDLDAEMTVVRNEFEIGENDPFGVLHDQMMAAAYRFHNYGKTTIGNRSDIERVPVESLQAFYKRYYQPDNAVLLVAGKFTKEEAWQLIQQTFGAIPRPSRILDATYTEEPTQDGPRSVRLQRVGEVAVSGLGYHIPAGSHPDFAALQVLAAVLTREPSGILYQALVEKGLASDVFGLAYALKEPGMLLLFSKPIEAGKLDGVHEAMRSIVENQIAELMTEQYVERAKAQILKSMKLAMANSKELALKLSESIAQGGFQLFFIHRDRVKAVTLPDVQRVARQYLLESNRTAGFFVPTQNPQRALIPTVSNLEQLLQAYAGLGAGQVGEEFEATVANIEKRVLRKALPGGRIKVAFLQKQTRQQAVRARLIFRFGNEEAMTPYQTELELLPSLLMRGTKEKTYTQIQDRMNELESSMRISGGLGAVAVDIQSDQEHLTDMLLLAAEVMQKPAFQKQEWEIVRQRELADLEESAFDPERLGFNTLERFKNPWPEKSVFYVPTFEEKKKRILNISLFSLQDLYQRLYGAQHLDVAIVGAFDPQRVEQLLLQAFDGWVSRVSYQHLIKPHRPVAAEQKVIRIPDKQMALVAMATNFDMKDDSPDYPAMRFSNYLFGEGMKARLLQRVREKEGFSYTAGSWLEIGRFEPSAHFSMYAMAANANVDPTAKAMKEEYQKWIQEGPTKEELVEGQVSFRLKFHNSLANDAYVVNKLSLDLENDRTFWFDDAVLHAIEQLTTEKLKETLKTHLGPLLLAEVKAGDL